jgi:hypothetical protein
MCVLDRLKEKINKIIEREREREKVKDQKAKQSMDQKYQKLTESPRATPSRKYLTASK